jgi:hypothetical protein
MDSAIPKDAAPFSCLVAYSGWTGIVVAAEGDEAAAVETVVDDMEMQVACGLKDEPVTEYTVHRLGSVLPWVIPCLGNGICSFGNALPWQRNTQL